MITIDQQLKHNDCGISAVKTIYNLFDMQVSRSYIEENIHLDEQGSSIHDIKEFLDKNNFEATFRFLDLNTLKFDIQVIKETIPCILPVKNSQGLHYVIISGIKGKKIQVLDPAMGHSYQWTFSELLQHSYHSFVQYDWVSNKHLVEQIIGQELTAYDISKADLPDQDDAQIVNKLTYFTYIKENFGFAHSNAEKNFLIDLLNNLQISTLPRQFRSIKLSNEKLQIKAPVVLTVAKKTDVIPNILNNIPGEPTTNVYIKLFRELKSYHKLWAIYIFSAVFAALITQIMVFSNQILIDNVLPGFNTNILVLFAVGLGIFKIFDLLLSLYKNFIAIHLANILDNYFLTSFMEKLNSYPIRFIHTYSKGDLTERIKDSLRLKTFFIRFFTRILIDGFVTVYSLCILAYLNWKVTFIVIGILLIFLIWFKVITPYIRENEKRRFLEKSNLFSGLFENIEGLQVIKSFRLENLFQRRIYPRIKNILNIQRKVRYVNLVNSGVNSLIIILASILIILILSYDAIKTQSITIGQIITFIALSQRIFSSVSSILDENLDIQENQIILKRYFDFSVDNLATERMPVHQKMPLTEVNTVEFKNVSFGYIPQKPVLSNLNISIRKGDLIRLVGNNGEGKSTFCKVLSLLYAADAGDILINNDKFQFYNQSSIREKILLVSNDDTLFNDTLGFNVKFSYNSSTSEIMALARETGFYEFIAEKQEGLDFIINEDGRNLSTGQKKKILILRALLSSAEIIILDEVLSGIDRESREKIEAYIMNEKKRSFIIISHEPLQHIEFNKIYNMKNGNIYEL